MGAGLQDFDFWLGTWRAVWEDGEGQNVVTRSFDGRVIEERFDGRPDLVGTSYSVFNEPRGCWNQTWVDDSGNYFALEGRLEDRDMVLLCDTHNGPNQDVTYRMRFADIRPSAFTWTWEKRVDGGDYELGWRIEYERI